MIYLVAVVAFALGWIGCVIWNLLSFSVANKAEDLRNVKAMNAARVSLARADAKKRWNEANAIAPVIRTDETERWIKDHRWAKCLDTLFVAADERGWSSRSLTPQVMIYAEWSRLTKHLIMVDILVKDHDAKKGIHWAPGVDCDAARSKLAAGKIPLPHWNVPNIVYSSVALNAQSGEKQ